MPHSGSRRTVRRVAAFLAIFVVVFFGGYAALANAFLRFGGVEKMFAGTRSAKAEFASAWTVWPGVVHVRGLRVWIEDHNVQSLISLEQGTLHVSLHELPRMIFHATKVRGSGLSFRFRHKVMPESRYLAAVSALPHIDGFSDPPVFEAMAPEAPVSDADYSLWTVHLDDVDVTAKEIFAEHFQYLGAARAVGAFRLKPARELWVGPATLTLAPGRLVAAGRDALRAFSGRIECTVHDFDVRIPTGLTVLRNVSAKVFLHGDVVDGRAAELFTEPGVDVSVRGGKLDVHVTADHGVLGRDTQVRFGALAMDVTDGARGMSFSGPVAVVGSVPDERDARAAFLATRVTARGRACDHTTLTAKGLRAAVDSTSADLASTWEFRRASLAAEDAQVAARWDDVAASGSGRLALSVAADVPGQKAALFLDADARRLQVVAGEGPPKRFRATLPSVRVHADLRGPALEGPVTVAVHRGELEAGAVTMVGNVDATFHATAETKNHPGASVSGNVDVKDVSFWNGKKRIDGWWASLRLPRFSFRAERTLGLDGTVDARFRDGLPGLLTLSATEQVPGFLPGLLPLQDLHGTLRVRRRCSLMDVFVENVEGGPLTFAGRLQNVPGETRGAILARFRDVGFLSAGIELGNDAGGPSFLASDAWLSRKDAELERISEWVGARSCGPPAHERCVD